jgi:hypothetical protein
LFLWSGVSVYVVRRFSATKGEGFTAQIGIPLMESAEVGERTERLTMKTRGAELKLRPRISNFGKGIEQIGIKKSWWKICGKKTTSDYFKMKIL